MSVPQVQWWNAGNTAQITTWNAQVVDAKSYSDELEVLVWNNKGGAESVPDMTNVFVTTKDLDGNNTGLVATKSAAYVEVQLHDGSAWGGTWEAVGGTDTLTIINANGEAGKIYGTNNDGNINTALTKKNFARFRLRLYVLETAPAGLLSWLTRVSYQYT